MNHIYLVRHGENVANLTKELSSRIVDYSLTPKGVVQAQQTAQYFAGRNIQAVYSSPLKRAQETAGMIASSLNLKPIVVEEFREIDVGELEEPPSTPEKWELHNQIIMRWFAGDLEAGFPGGDTYLSLWSRMQAGLQQATHGRENENIIIVGHSGIFTATLKKVCPSIDLEWLRLSQNHNCSITEIQVDNHDGVLEGELVRWADVSHLSGNAAEFISSFPNPDPFVEKG